MATDVILSQLAQRAVAEPKDFKGLAAKVSETIKRECPGLKWKDSYATMGRLDVVDVVESHDATQVEKAAMIIRAYGHASTETLLATPWQEFLDAL